MEQAEAAVKAARAAHLAPYRWQPGQSGNGRGQEPGVVARIRRQTRNGRELVDRLLAIARGEAIETTEVGADGKEVVVRRSPPIKDRREALVWLLEKLAGKPRQEVGVTGDRPPFMILLRKRPGAVDPLSPARTVYNGLTPS